MGNLVLIVDDDEKLQKLLKEYLENNGFRVLGLGTDLMFWKPSERNLRIW